MTHWDTLPVDRKGPPLPFEHRVGGPTLPAWSGGFETRPRGEPGSIRLDAIRKTRSKAVSR